jgi:hypothetical protein
MDKHPIYRVTSVEISGPYVLNVGFDDGTTQVIDFRPVLAGEVLGPLRELALFERVAINPEMRTLTWPNGADFDPATLHDWPVYVDALAALARKWELNPA